MKEILCTDRLILREITEADLPVLEQIYGDPVCMRYYPAVKDAAATREFFTRLAFDSYAKNGFGLWAVIDRASGKLLGDCGITLQPTPAGMECEIGYHLWREFWGHGLATEAARACRNIADRQYRQARQRALAKGRRARASAARSVYQT